MSGPRVSVICLCYNHRSFLREALESVFAQTYSNVEVVVVDDCSTDGSSELIGELVGLHPGMQTLLLAENIGNCKAFNRGLSVANGQYVIDFATDDVMMPDRIAKQVDFFQRQSERVGVIFTDAIYIDEHGRPLRSHFEYLFKKKLIHHIPTGDVFRDVLTMYFVCSPTMMMRRKVLDALHGYDETLAYEDFDFWVRASRDFQFLLLNEKLTKVRRASGSLSRGWYQPGDRQLHSTFLVCEKAVTLCRDEADRNALRWRLLYEFKQSAFSGNKDEARLFAQLLRPLGGVPASYYAIQFAAWIPLPWALIRKIYYQLRYR